MKCAHERQASARGEMPCAVATCPGNEGYGDTFRVPLRARDTEAGAYWSDRATSRVGHTQCVDYESVRGRWVIRRAPGEPVK